MMLIALIVFAAVAMGAVLPQAGQDARVANGQKSGSLIPRNILNTTCYGADLAGTREHGARDDAVLDAIQTL
ncbi:hypothetical protein PG997_001916 [Apiospora hydei]|uniref:Uncharacterized protein n=1 Tax=Apiospora hydei TaxID=1337664 RepID=A0ABR1X7X4_9PEZI